MKSRAPVSGPLPAEQTLARLNAVFAEVEDDTKFFGELASYLHELTGARVVTIHRRIGEESRPLAQAASTQVEAAGFSANAAFLEQLNHRFAARSSGRSVLRTSAGPLTVLVVPFITAGEGAIAFSLFLGAEQAPFVEPTFTIAHLATQFLAQRDLFLKGRESNDAFHQATMLVEMFTRANRAGTLDRACFTFATELAHFFGCDRVAIATGNERRCHIRAVSGATKIDVRGMGNHELGAAMRESIAIGKAMTWPRQHDLPHEVVVSASHDDLLRVFHASRLLVAPLYGADDDFAIGAIAFLWTKAEFQIDDRAAALVKASRPHAGALLDLLEQSKPGKIGQFFRNLWPRRGSRIRKVGTLTAGALAILLMFLPITYRVKASATLEPVIRRTVAAPFDNLLQKSNVRPGQLVERGDLLATLDGREIRWRLAEAIAARSAAEKKADEARVSAEPAAQQVAGLEAERLRLQVELLQFQRDNLELLAPIDGVILSGELERNEGAPIKTGESLFEIAPLDRMVVEIAVAERDVRHVSIGDSVDLRLDSRASFEWESELTRIHPISQQIEAKNVFLCEAILNNQGNQLRPGMRAMAKIDTGKRSLGWVVFHRLFEWLQLKL